MSRISLPIFAVALAGIGFTATASARDYDGSWQVTVACGPSSATQAPAFVERFTASIANDEFSRTLTLRPANGAEIVQRWRGRIANGVLTLGAEVTRGNERWSLRFAGPALADTRFVLPGGVFGGGDRKIRDCEIALLSLAAAPQSLAATAPARELAAMRTALDTARAEAEAARDRAADLGSDLDNARFEANTLRTEVERLRSATAEGERAQAALAAARREVTEAAQRLAAETARATRIEEALAAARRDTVQAQAEVDRLTRELAEARNR
jgi:pyruvate/2-oxoglutarate dehydrogenase complex dihydrolipoamide acyltransferase (E2) component